MCFESFVSLEDAIRLKTVAAADHHSQSMQ